MNPEDRKALMEWGLEQMAKLLETTERVDLIVAVFALERDLFEKSTKLAEVFIAANGHLSSMPRRHPLYLELYTRLVRFGFEQLERSVWPYEP